MLASGLVLICLSGDVLACGKWTRPRDLLAGLNSDSCRGHCSLAPEKWDPEASFGSSRVHPRVVVGLGRGLWGTGRPFQGPGSRTGQGESWWFPRCLPGFPATRGRHTLTLSGNLCPGPSQIAGLSLVHMQLHMLGPSPFLGALKTGEPA